MTNNAKKGASKGTSGKASSNPKTTEKCHPVVDEEGFWSVDGKRKAHTLSPKSEKVTKSQKIPFMGTWVVIYFRE